jgi:uncharacterized protein
MRRSEYDSHDPEEFAIIVSTAEVGHLGLVTPDGYPRVVPINFVADGTTIYLHGASAGEKYGVLQATPKVTFSVEIPYSIIPSYWISPDYVGGATHYFKSILIRGTGRIIDDLTEKARALQLLMEKYQPEGQFPPVSTDNPLYGEILKKTAVFRIDPVHIDMKIKFPFNKPDSFIRSLIDKLTARSSGPDLATAEVLRKHLNTNT